MSQEQVKKYIFVNGVMTINPQYQKTNNNLNNQTISNNNINNNFNNNKSNVLPLAIISCSNDFEMAKNCKYSEMEEESPVELALGTINAMNFMKQDEYKNLYGVNIEEDLFAGLTDHFVVYEVPIGLVSKLLMLKDYRLHFMVDDSGSMSSKTEMTFGQATQHIRQNNNPLLFLTRLQEAEDRLHIIFDILAYIPVKSIIVSFMNSSLRLSFTTYNKTPQMFQIEAHSIFRQTFQSLRLGSTPTYSTLEKSFTESNQYNDPTIHFLLTDGVPSDTSIINLCNFIQTRRNPQKNPIQLISCTNVDAECQWMKDLEEKVQYCSELDDYNDEKHEVLQDQGPAFPYSRGLWIVSHLISSICPYDLDSIDEEVPFSKYTLDELMGRIHDKREYEYYFKHHPSNKKYKKYYQQLLTESRHAKEIVPKIISSSVCNIM